MCIYLYSSGAQAVQKDGGSREDVDIQYGDNSIEIRLKDDQPPEKQGLCFRPQSRCETSSLKHYN